MTNPCLLYLITPPQFTLPSFTEQLKSAFDGGEIACLQLRMKEASDEDILRVGEALHSICDSRGIPLIINDRPDLALKLGAEGVHVGYEGVKKQEGHITSIRKQMGENAIIGASCYDSRDLAITAGEEGADYVSFGAFFPTKTKQSPGKPTPELLSWWSTYTVLPCVAIGGITAENCAPLVEAGVDFLAVISFIWEHPTGPAKAVAEIHSVIEKVIAKRDGKG